MEVNYHKRYLHSQYMNWLVNFSTVPMSQIDWGKKDTRTGGKISLLANSSSVSGIVKKWTFGSINLQWQEDELTTSWRLNLCRHSVRNHCHWWIGKVRNLHAWAREQRERERETKMSSSYSGLCLTTHVLKECGSQLWGKPHSEFENWLFLVTYISKSCNRIQ